MIIACLKNKKKYLKIVLNSGLPLTLSTSVIHTFDRKLHKDVCI
jgi:hypothetical protein